MEPIKQKLFWLEWFHIIYIHCTEHKDKGFDTTRPISKASLKWTGDIDFVGVDSDGRGMLISVKLKLLFTSFREEKDLEYLQCK